MIVGMHLSESGSHSLGTFMNIDWGNKGNMAGPSSYHPEKA